MVIQEKIVDAILDKYIRENTVLSFGTSKLSEQFVKKIALKTLDLNEDRASA